MKYQRFEDLPVWRAASELFVAVDALCEQGVITRGDLADQLHRASLSISNNIAEGFELGTTQQLITFLYTARGSAGEVRSMLLQMEKLPRMAHLKSQISNLKSQSEGISRQLRAWAESLQNSEIKGQRYLTDTDREAADRRARRAESEARIKAIAERARLRESEEGDETEVPSELGNTSARAVPSHRPARSQGNL